MYPQDCLILGIDKTRGMVYYGYRRERGFAATPANIGYTLVRDRDRKTFGLYRKKPGSPLLTCTELFGMCVFADDGSEGFRLVISAPAPA